MYTYTCMYILYGVNGLYAIYGIFGNHSVSFHNFLPQTLPFLFIRLEKINVGVCWKWWLVFSRSAWVLLRVAHLAPRWITIQPSSDEVHDWDQEKLCLLYSNLIRRLFHASKNSLNTLGLPICHKEFFWTNIFFVKKGLDKLNLSLLHNFPRAQGCPFRFSWDKNIMMFT